MPRPLPILVTAILVGARPALADAKAQPAIRDLNMDRERRCFLGVCGVRKALGRTSQDPLKRLQVMKEHLDKIHADSKTWSDTGL